MSQTYNERFDRKILIQIPVEEQTISGQLTQTWALFAGVWAKIVDDKGAGNARSSEQFIGAREYARRPIIFKIRYLHGINEKMRVAFDEHVYDITMIQEVSRRRYLYLTCEFRY